MKNILITGVAGFIGSHLSEKLLSIGNKIIGLDNFITGSKDNIKHLLKNKNFKFIEHDIINPIFIDDKIDEIYNLACPASPRHYQANSVRTIKVNTIGMINMLGFARNKKAKFLQASTSEVYGDSKIHPQPETYYGNVNPIGLRSCYDEGKRCAEALCFDYWRMHDIPIKIVRIFNTYGPKMDKQDGRVVSNFIIQALQGKNITIYGDGSQTRSFCYVDDLVDGLIKMMDTSNDFRGLVNLGNPHEFTIKQLADKILKLVDSKSKITYKDLPEDDPVKRKPDITLAKEKLDWEPTINLDDGIKRVIEYFR